MLPSNDRVFYGRRFLGVSTSIELRKHLLFGTCMRFEDILGIHGHISYGAVVAQQRGCGHGHKLRRMDC